MNVDPLQTLKRELMHERIELVESLDPGTVTLTMASGKVLRFAAAARHDGTMRVRARINVSLAVEL